MFFKRIIPFIILSFLSENALKCQDSVLSKLDEAILDIRTDDNLGNATWGICVMDAKSDSIIAGYNIQHGLIPASTLKLVTSGTAYFLLGDDFKYQTKLEYEGEIDKKGILNGNLIIKGDGDPTFGAARFGAQTNLDTIFKSWLKVLKAKKVKQVTGTVIADPGSYDYKLIHPDWMWGDIGNYYGAGPSGLNVMENIYRVWFRPGINIGDSARVVKFEPDIPGMNYINHVTTAAAESGDNVYIYGAPYSYLRFFEGTVPAGNDFSVRGSMPDPAYLCTSLFYKFLIQHGIEICEEPTTTVLEKFNHMIITHKSRTLATWTSPSLPEIIKQMNYWSINLYADALLLTLGKKIKHDGSYHGGVQVISEYLDKKFNVTELHMDDGSGLSQLNRISPLTQATILSEFSKEKKFTKFYNTIPVAGKSGTMTYILKGSIAEGKIIAKSGGMENVKSYTGYVHDSKGRLLSFSIIFNFFDTNPDIIQNRIERLLLLISLL